MSVLLTIYLWASHVHAILRDAPRNRTVIDIGCGTGWFPNTVAYHYGLKVVAIDLCKQALERAGQISRALGISGKIEFHHADIFNLNVNDIFYLVNSIGVLHHTHDCHKAIRMVSQLVAEDGFFNLGLYHSYGREPFLNLFKQYIDKLAQCGALSADEEAEAYAIFRGLNSNLSDETLIRSWFRDQVLHPFETQHSFQEIYELLTSLKFQILSTSVNDFKPIDDVQSLFELEKTFYDRSVEKNVNRKTYYPGFFTVLAKLNI
ncbi:MAG: class I SAM-dependent methyltransferase [Candidatus Auribacterota bacterium]